MKNEVMHGFMFTLGRKTVFAETNCRKKTKELAKKILAKTNLPNSPSDVSHLLRCLSKANCQLKSLSNGRQYYDIWGDNFGGYGDFVDEHKTVILHI